MPQSSFAGHVGAVMNMTSFSIGVPGTPTVPPVTTTRPWFSISNPGGLTGYDETQAIVGAPFDAHRVFHGTFVLDPTPLLQPEIAAGRIPIYSTKPPAILGQYSELADHLFALGGTIYASVCHEPENDQSAAQFEDNHTTFFEALADVPNVRVGPIYMAVTSTSPTRADFRAGIDTLPMDWLGVDGYNSENKRTARQIFNWWNLKAAERGIHWVIAEAAAHGTPAQRSAWWQAFRLQWEKDEWDNLDIVSAFDSGGGNRAGPSGWRLDTGLPDNWAVIDGIAQAVAPPPETVVDTLTPAVIHDALVETPRRTLGPTDPPVDPPDPLQQGALPLGSTAYPIPVSGVGFCSPGGRSAGAGNLGDPVNTVARALTIAGAGGTVVQRAGTYRERLWANPSYGAFTIQAYPGEVVWWDGTVVIPTSSWVVDGPQWRLDGQPLMAHDVTDPDIIFGVPLAAHPYQVFVDGVPLTIVATKAEATAGKYFVSDTAAVATYYIGTNPTGKLVEVSRLQEALTLNSGATVRGVGFKRYSPSINSTSTPHLGACKSMADNSRWEECHFDYHSSAALHMQENSTTTIERCTFTANGQMGIRGFLTMFATINQCAILYNDTRNYPGTGAGGGVKLDTNSHGAIFSNNLCVGNGAHSLWLDIMSHYGTIIGNTCLDCDSSGILVEGSLGCVVAGNIVDGSNFHGILVQNSGGAAVWNNTVKDAKFPINAQSQVNLWPNTGMIARNNLILQANPPASPVVFRGADVGSPANGTAADTMGITYDNNAVWRRAPGSTKYAEASLGGVLASYTTRALLDASALNWEANGVSSDSTDPNPYANLTTYALIPGSPLLAAGDALPAGIGDLLGLAPGDPRRLAPNIGAVL